MTHDDDVERVKEMIFAAYLDMDASDLAKRMNAGMSAREALQLSLNGIIPEVISAYRHAALSAMPPRELWIGDMMIRHSPNGIWIGRRGGEGGEFATERVERVIAQFYRENF